MSGKARKILIIGGNRFVGLRLSLLLEKIPGVELHILNRTGQAPHCKSAIVHKGDRKALSTTSVDRDYDVVYDFAGFDDHDLKSAVDHFTSVSRYIFISTSSVYDLGAALKEEAFDPARPLGPRVPSTAVRALTYQDGKRRAEATLTEEKKFPFVSVRFPVILGEDDYTYRLDFHVRHMNQGDAIFIPDLKARVSMVDSSDAADFLLWCLDQSFTGPINVASPDPISLGELIAQIEKIANRQILLTQKDKGTNHSPYAPESDNYLDVSKMQKLGFNTRPISAWLPKLIAGLVNPGPESALH